MIHHDLSYMTTDELVEELYRRFDGVVVVTELKKSDREFEVQQFWGGRFGSITYALGLVSRAITRLRHRINQQATAEDGYENDDCDDD